MELALSRLSDRDLAGIAASTYTKPALGPPGLLAWLEHVVDVERHSRARVDLPTLGPHKAIPEEEEVEALGALLALRDAARDYGHRALYAAMLDVLGEGTRH